MIDVHGNVVTERFMIHRQADDWCVVDGSTNRTVFTSPFMAWCETCVERLSGRYDSMVAQWFKHYRVRA